MVSTRKAELVEAQVEGQRLGRHVEHDEKSASYSIQVDMSAPLKSVTHERRVSIFDQGNLGSCTGNAGTGLLGTDPFYTTLPATVQQQLNEAFAVQLYSDATRKDGFKGTYPPDDTGSSGLAIGKVLKSRGEIKSYKHAFGLLHALQSLQAVPLIIGVPWYSSMDSPGQNGLVRVDPSSPIRGGHEIEVVGMQVDQSDPNSPKGLIRLANSWSSSWGDGGYFEMSFDDFGLLLKHQGDVMSFVTV